MASEADIDRLHWAHIFALRTLHEATLSDLLGARNYAAKQILRERNNLLRERYSTLGSIFCAAGLTLFSLKGGSWSSQDRVFRHRLYHSA
jgi:hypothetical protein